MQMTAFNAICPFEIGDKVYVVGQRMAQMKSPGDAKTITDIACVHYVKSGKVQFLYELDGDGKYVPFTTPQGEEGTGE